MMLMVDLFLQTTNVSNEYFMIMFPSPFPHPLLLDRMSAGLCCSIAHSGHYHRGQHGL